MLKKSDMKALIRKAARTLAALLVINLITGAVLVGAAFAAPAGILQKITEEDRRDYSFIGFQFGKRVRFGQPVIEGNEAVILFKNVTTKLESFQKLNRSNSWAKLNQDGEDLRVRIGLPKNFQELRYFATRKKPFKVSVRLYKAGSPLSSLEGEPAVIAAASSETPQTDYSNQGQPASAAPNKEVGKNPRSADPLADKGLLTLNFNQSEIKDILLSVAMNRNISIIMTPDISGKVSVHLYRIPVEEALGSIAMAGGFTYLKRGNVFYFYKPKEIRDPQSERLEMRIFQLKFAAIDKVQDILSAIPGMRTVKIHEQSKTVIVEDTPENIRKIETLISQWDAMPRQVLIEAKIIQILLNDDMVMGVDWQKVMGDLTIGTTGLIIPQAGAFAQLVTATGTSGAFTAALNFLQGITDVNFLSTPKILAIHGKAARVQVGGKQGYKVTTSNMGVTSETIQFIDTGTILEITPYIDDSGNVLLTVQPSINSVTIDNVTGIPVVKSTTVSTSLMAKNGETVLIGGLIEETKTISRSYVPWFGEIPVLGLLFGQKKRNIGKSEFVVLITPHIQETEIKRQSDQGVDKAKKLTETMSKEPLPQLKRIIEPVPQK